MQTPACLLYTSCQGYKDDSFWARGQAWGVYGSAIGYTYTHDEKFLDVFRKALEFYLSRLPEDMIPCWDLLFAPESGEPRDSSSAAIVACGLLEAAKYVDEAEAAQWRTLARQMLASLAANYAVKPGTLGSGQLLHGTYSKKSPYNTCTPEGVDECLSLIHIFLHHGCKLCKRTRKCRLQCKKVHLFLKDTEKLQLFPDVYKRQLSR